MYAVAAVAAVVTGFSEYAFAVLRRAVELNFFCIAAVSLLLLLQAAVPVPVLRGAGCGAAAADVHLRLPGQAAGVRAGWASSLAAILDRVSIACRGLKLS